MTEGYEHTIRERAYELWMAAGMLDGEAVDHWLRAETIVRTEAPVAAIVKTKTAKATGKSAGAAKPKTASVRKSKAASSVVALQAGA